MSLLASTRGRHKARGPENPTDCQSGDERMPWGTKGPNRPEGGDAGGADGCQKKRGKGPKTTDNARSTAKTPEALAGAMISVLRRRRPLAMR